MNIRIPRALLSVSLLVFLLPFESFGQDTTSPIITVGGYIDTYYASDNDHNPTTTRSMYNALNTRKKEFGLNIAQGECKKQSVYY